MKIVKQFSLSLSLSFFEILFFEARVLKNLLRDFYYLYRLLLLLGTPFLLLFLFADFYYFYYYCSPKSFPFLLITHQFCVVYFKIFM